MVNALQILLHIPLLQYMFSPYIFLNYWQVFPLSNLDYLPSTQWHKSMFNPPIQEIPY